jgi:lipid A disaccharide synthetase
VASKQSFRTRMKIRDGNPYVDVLIPSRKKEILRYFSWLKSPEARARNVARAIHVLSGHKARFMGRAWSKGV